MKCDTNFLKFLKVRVSVPSSLTSLADFWTCCMGRLWLINLSGHQVCPCNMVKVGEAKTQKRMKMGEFINLTEVGGICNMHLWLRGDRRPCWPFLWGVELQNFSLAKRAHCWVELIQVLVKGNWDVGLLWSQSTGFNVNFRLMVMVTRIIHVWRHCLLASQLVVYLHCNTLLAPCQQGVAIPDVVAIVANWDTTRVFIKATGEFSSLQFHCFHIIRTKIWCLALKIS